MAAHGRSVRTPAEALQRMSGSEGQPVGRAELHFHLLPAVDDGPVNMEVSVELARLAVRDGTAVVVATPHVREVRVAEVPHRVGELRARLEREGVALEVLPGGELAHDDLEHLEPDDLALIAQGPDEAPWMLLEAPLERGRLAGLHATADELRSRGYGVLLGHPERSADLFADDEAGLRRELDQGALLQVNAPSLLGVHGGPARERARGLARRGLVSVLASDAHRPTRGPALTLGVEALVAEGVDRPTAEATVDVTPAALLRHGWAGTARPAAA